MKKFKETNLVGQFFHTLNQRGKIEYQGKIIGRPEPGYYLVQLFEWLMGEPSIQKVFHISDMKQWFIYNDAQTMRFSYDCGTARAGGAFRDDPKSIEKEPRCDPEVARKSFKQMREECERSLEDSK